TLTMSLPFGDVVLDDSGRPLVFCSAGIGITPMAGMLSHLVAAGSHFDVRVLHACHDEATFALRDQVLTDVAALPHAQVHLWFEEGVAEDGGSPLNADGVHAGLMDLTDLDPPATALPAGAAYYLC